MLEIVDGPGPKTEIDIFLLGNRNLVVLEAKRLAGFGRCSRYAKKRCPEIHREGFDDERECQYWMIEGVSFASQLNLGSRPDPDTSSPPCYTHYQLARTLTAGVHLSQLLDLNLHLWILTLRNRWLVLERPWLDFVERIRDDGIWRRARVLAWEDLEDLRVSGTGSASNA
jgi:hypothetical protein